MSYSGSFDRAVGAVVDGEVEALRALLTSEPGLHRARSADAFRATLLHFVAANGVPDELQRSPANAVEICELLLAAGAAVDALSGSYGGGPNQTTLCLLASSWPPYERGVQPDLVRALVAGGAAVNGLRDDGAPLATALVFGYTSAAEALVDCGARVDNLFFAAGLGRDDEVRRLADDLRGTSGARVALGTYTPPLRKDPSHAPAELLQEALHFALTHGRRATAELLLARGADVNGRVEGHHCELPLLQVLFVNEPAMLPLLLERGADPDLEDGKRGMSAREHVLRHGPAEALPLLGGR